MDALTSLRQSTGAARCLACGKCTTLCPLALRGGGFSAREIAAHELEEEIQGRGEGIGRCLTCASCEVRCPQGVRFAEFVRGLREQIPAESRRAPPHDGVFQSVARSMAGGGEPARSTGWIGDGLEVAEEGEVALFVGCLPWFDVYFEDLQVQTVEIARSAIRVLNELRIRPVLVAQERCCGHDLLWGGDRESFLALARANCEIYRARGVKQVLTTCAECCRTWRVDYAEAVPEFQPRVEHFAEFLAPRVEAGQLRFREDRETTLTYQDPCRLGRHLGVLDPPRRVLAALPGARVVEMRRSGRDALCCGTSGFIHCDAASRALQAGRLQQAADTGADTLVTACPKCLIHFACAQAEDRRRERREPDIRILDFTVLAASRLVRGGDGKRSVPAPGGQGTGDAR
jgi:Fe-S oxidoreductase